MTLPQALGIILLLPIPVTVFAQQKAPITPQATRGRELFVNSPKGQPCGTCHSMDGAGTAVGPDLGKLAAVVGPRGIVMTINMTMTAYVQEHTLKSGGKFAGLEKSHEGDTVSVWVLEKTPPELRTVHASDIVSGKQNEKWKHPPASAGYSPQEFADIVGFLKWAAAGSQKEVSPDEVK